MAEPKKAGLFRYLKEAFMFRWNLLILGGASAAAVISGHPDIALPLVAAAEVTYLAGLTTLPRFQGAIDAKARAEERGLTGTQATASPATQASARDKHPRRPQVADRGPPVAVPAAARALRRDDADRERGARRDR